MNIKLGGLSAESNRSGAELNPALITLSQFVNLSPPKSMYERRFRAHMVHRTLPSHTCFSVSFTSLHRTNVPFSLKPQHHIKVDTSLR